MALKSEWCAPTKFTDFRPPAFSSSIRLKRSSIGANPVNPTWVAPQSTRLQRRFAKWGHFFARSSVKSIGGENKCSVGDRDGIIIVDHGSRRRESNLMLNEFVAMFKDRTGYTIVEPAHMELAEPSIKDAFSSCVRRGANRIIVSPFFLFPGRHWHQDIPSLAAEAAKDHPGVSYIVTAPLGLHVSMVDVMNDRIKHCLSHALGDGDDCAVCTGADKCHIH